MTLNSQPPLQTVTPCRFIVCAYNAPFFVLLHENQGTFLMVMPPCLNKYQTSRDPKHLLQERGSQSYNCSRSNIFIPQSNKEAEINFSFKRIQNQAKAKRKKDSVIVTEYVNSRENGHPKIMTASPLLFSQRRYAI